MFTVDFQTRNTIVSVVPEGRLDTINSSHFNEMLKSVLESEKYLILDFSKCNYLSSSGIRTLMTSSRILAAKGGCLVLAGLPPEIYQVIEMTGLQNVFRIFRNSPEAIDHILKLSKTDFTSTEIQTGQFSFHYKQLENNPRTAQIWVNQGIAGYNELGIAIGAGSPADSPVEDESDRGLFVTVKNCSGFIPAYDSLPPDFRVVSNPASGGIYLQWVVSFPESPDAMVKLTNSDPVSGNLLVENISQLAEKNGTGPLKVLLIADYNATTPSLSLIYITNSSGSSVNDPEIPLSLSGFTQTISNGMNLLGARFMLNNLPQLQPGETFYNLAGKSLTIDNIEEVSLIDLSTEITDPVIWLFYAGSWCIAEDNRIKVELPENSLFEQHKVFLTRRLYTDSARVVIKPLHGGYSAQTFQVESFDHAGRKLRPTVLKIANRALITREAERCKKFSLPFIMNNSAMVLGTEFFGDTGALRYNFVGIGGEQTQLKWLTHCFNSWSTEELEPLFDKIFLQILKPWYGQPVKENIFPFRDHDPTLTFFTRLCETAEEILSVSPDEQFMVVEETGEKMLNHYWYLKHRYVERRNDAIPYLTSVCHGDLNMQNILLDRELNVYLIDFSETRPRAVISDFARLEAIFMIEHAPLENAEDLKNMFAFVRTFYDNESIDSLPQNNWTGSALEKMNRNISLTLKMRNYAISCTAGIKTIVPYYMSMLEWVLPIVCYTGLPLYHKKLSAYVAGLLCEKVAEADFSTLK